VARHFSFSRRLCVIEFCGFTALEKIPLPMRLGLIPGLSGAYQTCVSLDQFLDSDIDKSSSREFEALQLHP